MIDKLRSPAVAAVLGIGLSVAVGASMCLRVLGPLVEHIAMVAGTLY